ncbi:MAG: alpha/beta hydrolase, partial [Lachnospiraceae bacterium]|nr:alpha/beta hydrolase [Lachnospiraceae bacterium]
MKRIIKIVCLILLTIAVFIGSVGLGGYIGYFYLIYQSYQYLIHNRQDSTVEIVKDIAYGKKDLNKYDLYLPRGCSKDSYSLVCFIHGGSFTGGDKDGYDARYYGNYLASKGYVMATVNYSLATEDNGVTINTMHRELINAVNHIQTTCKDMGYPVNEMAMTGISAGGCLAMLIGFENSEELAIPVKFVFEQTGPASFDPDLWNMNTDEAKKAFLFMLTGKNFSSNEIGGEDYYSSIEEISP